MALHGLEMAPKPVSKQAFQVAITDDDDAPAPQQDANGNIGILLGNSLTGTRRGRSGR